MTVLHSFQQNANLLVVFVITIGSNVAVTDQLT